MSRIIEIPSEILDYDGVKSVRKLHVSYVSITGTLNRIVLDCVIEYPSNYYLNSESLRDYIKKYVNKNCELIIAWNNEE